ncbi:hypothetical protein [Halobacterium zhouii]|uniref:hypothetical protein n=1 Tax=Halobacterium zhouii TaxID=2902624 RepID=UPI001E38A7E5|nr:hypothetical protein [Halobacterium zhouii]
MTFRDWAEESIERYRKYGALDATRRSTREFSMGVVRRIGRSIPAHGDYIFGKEWDVLIVLDACRWDALNEVKNEYKWLPENIPKVTSRGSHSREWMQENFVDKFPEERANTDYICWNVFESFELSEDNWHSLDPVWRTGGWDNDKGCIPPREVTDRGISKWRSTEADQLILHYMQPHTPYRNLEKVERLTEDRIGVEKTGRMTVWKLIRRGEVSPEEAWDAYIDNLRWVLDDLEILLENLDAEKVVLTADHGDCFGEFGFYGHPKGVPLPVLARVPWVEVSAEDTHSYEPTIEKETELEMNESVENRLEQLGYR